MSDEPKIEPVQNVQRQILAELKLITAFLSRIAINTSKNKPSEG